MSARWADGNEVVLLHSGREYFPALLEALTASRAEVFLETYIFAEDATASAVVEALCDAARRGAAVHLLIDGFGARDMSADYRLRLAAAGARLLVYRKPLIWRPVRGLRRLHRKIVTIDGTVAFVGGINIVDDWNTPDEVPPRYDYAVRLRGPLSAMIRDDARRLWARAGWGLLPQKHMPVPHLTPIPPVGSTRAGFAIRDSVAHRTDIEDAYLAAIRTARRSIWIVSGYFLPSRRMVTALREAAIRGVRVEILLQGPSDHPLMKAASQSLYRAMLAAGFGVLEYTRSFLHAKVATIDDHWATVGSSNLDPFSLMLSREANLLVEGDFARALRESIEAAVAEGATRIDEDALQRFSWWTRLVQWAAYRFARATVGWVTSGGRGVW